MALSKEKLKSLLVYQTALKSKLSSGTIPEKHKAYPATYFQFLRNELTTVTSTIENEKATAMVAPQAGAKK